MKIIINGTPVDVSVTYITYDRIVALADMQGYPSVTYRVALAGDAKRDGELHSGCAAVKVEDGMVFSVMHTGNA